MVRTGLSRESTSFNGTDSGTEEKLSSDVGYRSTMPQYFGLGKRYWVMSLRRRIEVSRETSINRKNDADRVICGRRQLVRTVK